MSFAAFVDNGGHTQRGYAGSRRPVPGPWEVTWRGDIARAAGYSSGQGSTAAGPRSSGDRQQGAATARAKTVAANYEGGQGAVPRRRLQDLNYYELLSLRPDATHDRVKEAFHAFARRYHPDNAGTDPQAQARLTRIYRRGTEAYRVLIDASQRLAYDQGLRGGALRFDPSTVPSTTVPPARGGGRSVAHRARPFMHKAQAALRKRDFQSARLHLKLALGYDPEHPELLEMLQIVEAGPEAR